MANSRSNITGFDHLPRGLYFAAGTMVFNGVVLVTALLYRQQGLVWLSLALLLIAVALRVWGRLSSRRIAYTIRVDRSRVFPGEPVELAIGLVNDKALPVLIRFRLPAGGLSLPGNDPAEIEGGGGFLWYQSVVFKRVLRPTKRGIYQTGAPRLITADLFGFFPQVLTPSEQTDIVVFPRLVRLKPFDGLQRIMFGKAAVSSPVTDPAYMLGAIDYQAAGPARHIHWKASARYDRLQQKLFEPTEQENIILILEVDGFVQHHAEADFERMIEGLASLARQLIARRFAVHFLSNAVGIGGRDAYLCIRGNTGQLSRLLAHLAGLVLRSSTAMPSLLANRRYCPSGISCIYGSFRRSEAHHHWLQHRTPLVNLIVQSDDGEDEPPGAMPTGRRCLRLTDLFQEGADGPSG